MPGYGHLIEARLAMEKGRLLQSMADVGRRAGMRLRGVPHFTLVYSFEPLSRRSEIMERVRDVSRRYGSLDFVIDGFEVREGRRGHVLAFRVEPGRELAEFRRELYDGIRHMIRDRDDVLGYNTREDFWFHVTITTRLRDSTADRIRGIIGTPDPPDLPAPGQRPVRRITFPSEAVLITMLNRGRIYKEYDRLTDRILDRRQALSRAARYDTLREYRRRHGIERPAGRTSPGRAWVISDTHFDHANIIRYTGRPFSGAGEMNRIIESNWNNTVDPGDRVYFLGDMSFGRGSRPKEYWLGRLNGRITFIRGNHDTERGTVGRAVTRHGGLDLLMVHDPADRPADWTGWTIHGDKHNNRLREYPLVHPGNRTVNACAELVRYAPLDLDSVVRMIGEDRFRYVL
ncbi:MAG: 2'-5' RNA ligase family protein [Nitrosopumilus sp.]|nr:2'-5' RNA ligase family protein [Nitrosopumilus sp.]